MLNPQILFIKIIKKNTIISKIFILMCFFSNRGICTVHENPIPKTWRETIASTVDSFSDWQDRLEKLIQKEQRENLAQNQKAISYFDIMNHLALLPEAHLRNIEKYLHIDEDSIKVCQNKNEQEKEIIPFSFYFETSTDFECVEYFNETTTDFEYVEYPDTPRSRTSNLSYISKLSSDSSYTGSFSIYSTKNAPQTTLGLNNTSIAINMLPNSYKDEIFPVKIGNLSIDEFKISLLSPLKHSLELAGAKVFFLDKKKQHDTTEFNLKDLNKIDVLISIQFNSDSQEYNVTFARGGILETDLSIEINRAQFIYALFSPTQTFNINVGPYIQFVMEKAQALSQYNLHKNAYYKEPLSQRSECTQATPRGSESYWFKNYSTEIKNNLESFLNDHEDLLKLSPTDLKNEK